MFVVDTCPVMATILPAFRPGGRGGESNRRDGYHGSKACECLTCEDPPYRFLDTLCRHTSRAVIGMAKPSYRGPELSIHISFTADGTLLTGG